MAENTLPVDQTDQMLENGRFSVEVTTCPDSSKLCHAVRLTPMRFGVRDASTGNDSKYRKYAPGDLQNMEVELQFRSSDGTGDASGAASNKDVRKWLEDCKLGTVVRSAITIKMYDRAGGAAKRSWNLHDCFPVQLDYGSYSPDSQTNVTTLKCNVGYMDFGQT